MKEQKENKKNGKKKSSLPDEPVNFSFPKMEAYLNDFYQFKYNEVTNEIEYKKNSEPKFQTLDDMQINSIYIDYRKQKIKFGLKDFERLLYSSFTPRYNPFVDYFNELPQWDGTDYVEQLCNYVKVVGNNEQERFYNQTKKMLLRTLACAIDDTFFNKQIFLLYGDAQNQYKTSFLRNLVPKKLEKYTTEHFNPAGEKDNAIAMTENLIINIDELGNMLKFELNKLKSIISMLTVKIRLPFGKRAISIPRRASFVASTNIKEFLTDVTGNVRWICFHVDSIDENYRQLNMDKVWAQIYHLYNQDTEMQITRQEMIQNEDVNSRYQQQTAEMEMINKYFSQGTKNDSEFMTATDIVNHLSMLVTNSIRLNPVMIGRAMRYFNFQQDEKRNDEKKYPEKGYWINCSCKLCTEKITLANALN